MLLPSHITNKHCIRLEGWPDFQDMTPAGLSQTPMGRGSGGLQRNIKKLKEITKVRVLIRHEKRVETM